MSRPYLLYATACICLLSIVFCNRSSSPSAPPASARQSMTDVNQGKTITAGWAPYEPFASANVGDPGGRPKGYYIDLFERMATEAHLEVKWVETTWTTMIADLKVGKFQVMAAPVFRTIPRSMEVAFTRPIDYFGLSAVVRIDEQRFANILDANRSDVTIAVVQGEVGEEFVTRHLSKAKAIRHKSGNISVALVDVMQSRADIGVCDAWTVKQFVAEHPGSVKDLFADRPFNEVGAGWFVDPTDVQLLHFLNTSIDWLDSSGALQDISKNYDLPTYR